MRKVLGLAISPHPPIAIPEIGAGQEKEAQKTIDGMQEMAKAVASKKPEVIVVITPHGNVFADGICLLAEEKIEGDLERFGRPDLKMEKSVSLDILEDLSNAFEEKGIPSIFMNYSIGESYKAKVEIDHGAFVPLYYIDKQWSDYEIVHITIGMLSPIEMYELGKTIGEVLETAAYETIVLASGDMSHCLKEEGPYSYHPMGKVFDEKIVRAIEMGDARAIINMRKNVYEPAGECGLRPFAMGLGIFDGFELKSRVFSYEGPFGVGYMTAFLEPTGKKIESILENEMEKINEQYEDNKRKENSFVKLARNTIEYWVKHKEKVNFNEYKKSIDDKLWLNYVEENEAGVFVSIHKRDELRGCIGTIQPTQKNIAEEVISNAIQAAEEDPRFNPIREDELKTLNIKEDVLHEIEEINGLEELDIKKYGVIVESGNRRGLLLPNLEGISSVEEQVDIARNKAGIGKKDKYKLYRFEVTRYE